MTLSQLLINADPFIKARDTESQRQKGKKIPVSKTRCSPHSGHMTWVTLVRSSQNESREQSTIDAGYNKNPANKNMF